MKLPLSFYRDEVRYGFYVPTAIKQVWGALLTVLQEIDRVCERHGILYFAEWGTLLGAVRHGGFVPWDDDLDIGMRREDYNRFRAVADKELPPEFVIHDYASQENHWLFLSRVVNHSRICFELPHLEKFSNYPWLAGIDIFIQDYLYREEAAEEARRDEVLRLLAIADGVVRGQLSGEAVRASLREVCQRYGTGIDPDGKPRDIGVALYRLAEEQMARVKPSESDRMAQLFPWGLKGDTGLPKEYYDRTIRLPFETMDIPVPERYAEVLTKRYGPSCLEVKKVWGGHGYPSFEGQRAGLQQVADFKLPEFTWDPRWLVPANVAAGEVPAAATTGLPEEMPAANATAESPVDAGKALTAAASDPPEETPAANASAECPGAAGEVPTAAASDPSEEASGLPAPHKHRILFLPVGPREWSGSMQRLYEKTIAEPGAEVTVVPLPLLKKDALGQITGTDEELLAADEIEKYPPGLPIIRWFDYDPAEQYPDRIVFQNPYDNENPCLTVPPAYYAQTLRKSTRELLYLPAFPTDEFGEEDRNDLYNLKHYVTAPGVIFADRVLVQSENIRQRYIEKLVAFAGKDTAAHWEQRIEAAPELFAEPEDGRERSGRKKLLFCFGLNEPAEHREKLPAALRGRLRIFADNLEAIDLAVCPYPSEHASWDREAGQAETVFTMLQSFASEHHCEFIDGEFGRTNTPSALVNRCDAYYGSPSPYVPMFIRAKKPVMIMNLEVEEAADDGF